MVDLHCDLFIGNVKGKPVVSFDLDERRNVKYLFAPYHIARFDGFAVVPKAEIGVPLAKCIVHLRQNRAKALLTIESKPKDDRIEHIAK